MLGVTRFHRRVLSVVMFVLALAFPATADDLVVAVVPAVRRPVSLTLGLRVSRHDIGRYGESIAARALERRGFEVRRVVNHSGHGIDLIGVKRTGRGQIYDAVIQEVKTSRSGRRASLGLTRFGRQMSGDWLDAKFRTMRVSRDAATARLPLELERLRGAGGTIPLELGEVASRQFSTPVRVTRLGELGPGGRFTYARSVRLYSGFTPMAKTIPAAALMPRALRLGGRLVPGGIVLVEIAAGGLTAWQWWNGEIDDRTFYTNAVSSGAGALGAWGGAVLGAQLGVSASTLFPPGAVVIVPLFTAGGALAGWGVFGWVGGWASNLWYGPETEERITSWLLKTPFYDW